MPAALTQSFCFRCGVANSVSVVTAPLIRVGKSGYVDDGIEIALKHHSSATQQVPKKLGDKPSRTIEIEPAGSQINLSQRTQLVTALSRGLTSRCEHDERIGRNLIQALQHRCQHEPGTIVFKAGAFNFYDHSDSQRIMLSLLFF